MTHVKVTQRYLKEDYDRIFCVFDRNGHANYHEALQRIAESDRGKSGKLSVVPSWPCFEIWLLLHFTYTSAPFEAAGGR